MVTKLMKGYFTKGALVLNYKAFGQDLAKALFKTTLIHYSCSII